MTSKAQPKFSKLFAYSIVPIGVAVGVGFWLSGQIHADPDNLAQTQRTEEVVAQDRLLVDALWTAIDAIKTRALSLEQVRDAEKHSDARRPATTPDGLILHWAELEVSGGKLVGVLQAARNPLFQPIAGVEAFESFYLKSALARLNLHELQENGVTVLRIKQDTGHSQEWLAFAFGGLVHADSIAAEGSGATAPVLLALVDPSEVFPIFRRWTARSEGGNLRGYLIGNDGFVIAHSQHPYIASDFSRTQVFGQGVHELMQGRIRNGAGVYKAIDQVAVTAAFARPGTLPLAAVVERVNPKPEAHVVLASVWALVSAPLEDPAIALGSIAMLAMMLAAAMSGVVKRALVAAAAQQSQDSPGSPDPQDTDHAQEADAAQELPTVPEGTGASDPFENYSEDFKQAVLAPPMPVSETDSVEESFAHELLSEAEASPQAQARRSERVLLAQFETEAQQAQDPASVAKNLVVTTSRLAAAPALFFSYRESLRACLMQAHAGLPEGTSTQGLSFRLSDPMLVRIARYQKEGRTASLSDDPALMLLLSKRLGGARCEAWPVSGANGKLLGVLVVLGASSVRPDQSEGLGQVMKASGNLYERHQEV